MGERRAVREGRSSRKEDEGEVVGRACAGVRVSAVMVAMTARREGLETRLLKAVARSGETVMPDCIFRFLGSAGCDWWSWWPSLIAGGRDGEAVWGLAWSGCIRLWAEASAPHSPRLVADNSVEAQRVEVSREDMKYKMFSKCIYQTRNASGMGSNGKRSCCDGDHATTLGEPLHLHSS